MLEPSARAMVERPEDIRVLVPVTHTADACCGAAAAYLLRRIAYRAGAYAPGIQEQLFHELAVADDGANLDTVRRWFVRRSGVLHDLGYRVQARGTTTPTPELLTWVAQGRGYRGAVVPIGAHAVAISIDRLAVGDDELLVMIDPWPRGELERRAVPASLQAAHRTHGFQTLELYWVGWS